MKKFFKFIAQYWVILGSIMALIVVIYHREEMTTQSHPAFFYGLVILFTSIIIGIIIGAAKHWNSLKDKNHE